MQDPGRRGAPALLRRGDGDSSQRVPTPANSSSSRSLTRTPTRRCRPSRQRFAGDFMLTSQGDKEQIFVQGAGGPHQSLSVLTLSDSVDDTAWASDAGGALSTRPTTPTTRSTRSPGPSARGDVFVADTPCDANDAPSTCPAPGFPPNFLGQLNPETGSITRVRLIGPAVAAQGMYFRP